MDLSGRVCGVDKLKRKTIGDLIRYVSERASFK
jgi:hypothetical protein